MIARREPAKIRPVESWVDQPRVDAREKVTGQAKYVEDLSDLPGTVYAAAIHSPYLHARILSIDSSRVERLPGVLGVLHRENLDGFGLNLDMRPGDQNFITADKARFDGDLLGMDPFSYLTTCRAHLNSSLEMRPGYPTLRKSISRAAPSLY